MKPIYKEKYPHLFQPMYAGKNKVRFNNRALVGPMGSGATGGGEDSDGRINHFIDPQGMKSTLDLHPLKEGEEYYLGVFLVGAYQETLGDLHNLLGDTNVVSVRIQEDGSYEFARELNGDSNSDILAYVEYDPRKILEDIRHAAERAVREKRLTPTQRYALMQAYEDGMRGYTYFER